MKGLKTRRNGHLAAVDLQDMVEIFFGVLLGLLIFLGASELWNIGAILNDFMVMVIVAVNFVLLYLLTRFISGTIHKNMIFAESVRHPIERSLIVYAMGFFISFSTVLWLNQEGIFREFVHTGVTGMFPEYLRIAVLANLFATMFAITIDLSIAD